MRINIGNHNKILTYPMSSVESPSLTISVPENTQPSITISNTSSVKKQVKNTIPAPSIDLAMLHINTSYTMVSSLVETLYSEVKVILSQERDNDSLYARLIRILTLVVASVEQVSKTKTVITGMQKKDLAVAVTRSLVEKCLQGNKDLLDIYNVLIRDQIDEMIELLISVSRKVNSDGKQGNNGLREEPIKSGCVSLCLSLCGVKKI